MQSKITTNRKRKTRAGTFPEASRFSVTLLMLIAVFALGSSCELMKDLDEVVKDGKGKHVKPNLMLMAEGLIAPVWLEDVPDGSRNLLVAGQNGLIRFNTPEGNVLDDPFP